MVTGRSAAICIFQRAAAKHTKVRGNRCRLPRSFCLFYHYWAACADKVLKRGRREKKRPILSLPFFANDQNIFADRWFYNGFEQTGHRDCKFIV